jgi:non-homologous end joining protein Ku
VLRQKLSRGRSPLVSLTTAVGMEACVGAHLLSRYEEIVKGYEHSVLIHPKELDELKLEAKHTIDIWASPQWTQIG